MRVIQGVVDSQNQTISGVICEVDKTIAGILRDKNQTVYGIATSLTYRDYLTTDFVFLIKARELLANLQKQIELDDSFRIQANEMQTVAAKIATPEEIEFAISSTLHAAIEYAIAFENQTTIDTEALASLEKAMNFNELEYAILASDVNLQIKKLANIIGLFSIATSGDATLTKTSEINSALTVLSNISAQLQKYTSANEGAVLQSSVNIVMVYFRKMQDVYDLTMGDVYDWNMETLYMVTED